MVDCTTASKTAQGAFHRTSRGPALEERMYQGVTQPLTIISAGPQRDCSISCEHRVKLLCRFDDSAQMGYIRSVWRDSSSQAYGAGCVGTGELTVGE